MDILTLGNAVESTAILAQGASYTIDMNEFNSSSSLNIILSPQVDKILDIAGITLGAIAVILGVFRLFVFKKGGGGIIEKIGLKSIITCLVAGVLIYEFGLTVKIINVLWWAVSSVASGIGGMLP